MARAAALFFLAMVTGLWAGIVLSHGRAIGLELTPPRHERLALEAHIAAMLGAFWMIAVAYTLEHLRFGESGRRRMAQVVTLIAFGDWAVTILASVLDVRGIDFGGDAPNKIVAGLFQLLVVLPSLAASAAWAYGLRRGPSEAR
jgi:hypothetical protein